MMSTLKVKSKDPEFKGNATTKTSSMNTAADCRVRLVRSKKNWMTLICSPEQRTHPRLVALDYGFDRHIIGDCRQNMLAERNQEHQWYRAHNDPSDPPSSTVKDKSQVDHQNREEQGTT